VTTEPIDFPSRKNCVLLFTDFEIFEVRWVDISLFRRLSHSQHLKMLDLNILKNLKG